MLALVAGGCGGTDPAPPVSASRASASVPRECKQSASPSIVVCGYPIVESKRPSTIWLRGGGRLRRIGGPARIAMAGIPPKPVKNAWPAGFWVPDRLFRSPDGRWLLGQWSGECETQTAYVIEVATGKVRAIFDTKVRGITATNESTAHGWTADGRARVRLPYSIFATYPRVNVQAGMYDVDPVTLKRTLEERLPYGPHC
jgi:hypothetical protein